MLERSAYQEKPTRNDYHLTEKGTELAELLFAMIAWGDRWAFGEDGPPLALRHERCGAIARPAITCSDCGEPLRLGEVTPVPGPGLDSAGSAEEIGAARARFERLAAAAAG